MRQSWSAWTTELRLAVRALIRTPGFALITIGTLGLAIGVNAGIFSVVDTVLLRPLPYPHPERLIYVGSTAPGSQMSPEFGVSPELYLQFGEQSKLLNGVALFNSFTSTLRTADRVERIRMSAPTWNLFSTLGVRPILGRLPVAEDESRVMVISYALWQTWFGGDPAVIGKSYQAGGSNRVVIGVMGPDFRFPTDGTLLWFPTPVRAAGLVPGDFGARLVARMKPGASIAAVASELTGLAHQAPERFGGPPSYAHLMTQYRAVVRTLAQTMLGPVSTALWVLLGAVLIVLLIACANVANLFMVRAEGRQRDLAVRRAIGAGRGQLIRLQMAEAIVVAGCSGLLAMLLAVITLPIFVRAAPDGIPRIGDVHIGLVTLLFVVGAALVAAVACGLTPAIRASDPDLTRLREGGRGATRGRPWLRDGLVVAQTGLALVLLISSGLLIRSFAKLAQVKPGYDTRDVFTFQIAPSRPTLNDGPTFAQFQLNFMDRLRALPGVQSVGLVDNVPLNEGTQSGRFQVEGATNPDASVLLNSTFTAGDYFRTMGIAVLRGHPFTNAEASTPGHIVISKSAANLLWPAADPIGRRIRFEGDSVWQTVTGVVDDVLQDDFRTKAEAVIYLPMVGATPRSWAVSSPAYVVKTTRAETIAPEVRALVREVAPEAPMYRVYTMAGLAADSLASLSFMMMTLGLAAALALILGSVGLYGVLSYVVAQRTREIGVRMALGADAARVRWMVVRQGARVVGLGVVIGLAVALASTRALGSLLFGVGAIDVPTFLGMSAVLLLVGMLASYLPARRASSVDPIESLRGE
jgi:putative ABC transport system permease protein